MHHANQWHYESISHFSSIIKFLVFYYPNLKIKLFIQHCKRTKIPFEIHSFVFFPLLSSFFPQKTKLFVCSSALAPTRVATSFCCSSCSSPHETRSKLKKKLVAFCHSVFDKEWHERGGGSGNGGFSKKNEVNILIGNFSKFCLSLETSVCRILWLEFWIYSH